MTAGRIALLVATVAAVASAGGWWLREQRAVDSCLDSGGSWEAGGGYCVGAVYGPLQE